MNEKARQGQTLLVLIALALVSAGVYSYREPVMKWLTAQKQRYFPANTVQQEPAIPSEDQMRYKGMVVPLENKRHLVNALGAERGILVCSGQEFQLDEWRSIEKFPEVCVKVFEVRSTSGSRYQCAYPKKDETDENVVWYRCRQLGMDPEQPQSPGASPEPSTNPGQPPVGASASPTPTPDGTFKPWS